MKYIKKMLKYYKNDGSVFEYLVKQSELSGSEVAGNLNIVASYVSRLYKTERINNLMRSNIEKLFNVDSDIWEKTVIYGLFDGDELNVTSEVSSDVQMSDYYALSDVIDLIQEKESVYQKERDLLIRLLKSKQ